MLSLLALQQNCIRNYRRYADTVAVLSAIYHILKQDASLADYIGIENHVNYIYKIDGKLTEDESYGIISLLNSRLYNRYLHVINGSTQVNASEISEIPLPSLKKIRLIGSLVRKAKENDEIRNEKIIAKELNIGKKIISGLIKEI